MSFKVLPLGVFLFALSPHPGSFQYAPWFYLLDFGPLWPKSGVLAIHFIVNKEALST